MSENFVYWTESNGRQRVEKWVEIYTGAKIKVNNHCLSLQVLDGAGKHRRWRTQLIASEITVDGIDYKMLPETRYRTA